MVTGSIDDQDMNRHAISFDEAIDLLRNRVETTVSENPLRVTVTLDPETANVSVTLDGDMNVTDVGRGLRTNADTP